MGSYTSNIKHRLSVCIFTASFLLTLFLGISFASISTIASPCSFYTSREAPDGYAPPVNVYTGELMVNVDCKGDAAIIIGKRDQNDIPHNDIAVHTTVYAYKPGNNSWDPYPVLPVPPKNAEQSVKETWTSSNVIDSNYFKGYAETVGDVPYISDPTYVIAYFCHDADPKGPRDWKCGCSDTSCANRNWVIQAFRDPKKAEAAGSGDQISRCDDNGCYLCNKKGGGCTCTSGACLSGQPSIAGSSSGGGGGGGGDTIYNGGATGLHSTLLTAETALCIPSTLNGRQLSVTNANSLSAALNNANPGDTITLEDGVYKGNFILARSGEQGRPIVVRARSLSGASFNATFSINGNYVVLDGLQFNGPSAVVHIDGGHHNRVTRTVFRSFKTAAILLKNGASYNRVDRNDIASPPQDYGDNTNYAYGIQIELRTDDQNTVGNIFDRNYIHDFPTRINNDINGHEAIQIGQGPASTGWYVKTLIENNLLSNVNLDSEAISLKSSGNTVVGNTLVDSNAFLSNRNGSNNQWISNYVSGSVGLRIYGDNTQVIGNTMEGGASLRILAGDTNQSIYEANKPISGAVSPAARNTIVVGTQGPIVVGYSYNPPTYLAENTRLEANQEIATRISGNETGTVEQSETDILFTPAIRLGINDVGTRIRDPVCDGAI